MSQPRLDLVTDAEGLVLYVHRPCGATIWWDERPATGGGDGSIHGRVCDVCSPEASDVSGEWGRVWFVHGISRRPEEKRC